MGTIYKRGEVWWFGYRRGGKRFLESSGSEDKERARSLLRQREGDIEHGLPVSPANSRFKWDDAAADVENDYTTNGKRSVADVKRRIEKHLTPYFGGRRMSNITTTEIRAYVAHRQAEKITIGEGEQQSERTVSNAQINRELAIIKRAYSLAVQAGKLLYRPHVPMLTEHNVRTGFFTAAQIASVGKHLPGHIEPVIAFAHITGWRIRSEVLKLQWRQVDFDAGTVTLDPGTTKNAEGRVFVMTAELRRLLQQQHALTKKLERKQKKIIQPVFHIDGEPIKPFSYYRDWRAACKRAGVPGRIPHDLRRSAVRNLVRAGVPERVAMMMTGHKTRSVFERYNIVSEGDLREASRKLDTAAFVDARHKHQR